MDFLLNKTTTSYLNGSTSMQPQASSRRPAYALKLTGHQPKLDAIENNPTRQEEFYTPHKFEYFGEHLFQPAQSGQDLLPLLFNSFESLVPAPISYTFTENSFNAPEHQKEKAPNQRVQPAAPVKVRLSDQELESQNRKLVLDVISNLFTSKKEIIEREALLNRPKKPVNRNLFCHDKESLRKAKSDAPIKMSLLKDLDTTDDLVGRMENLMKKEKPPKPTFSLLPKISDWDTNLLPHVLEIYGVPEYKIKDDVVKAMETIGYGDCRIHWQERKIVLAVFENAACAKNCQTMVKHDWLRFRALTDSPKTVQDFVKTNVSTLSKPIKKQNTNARQCVKEALGQKSKNQLAAARRIASKKNSLKKCLKKYSAAYPNSEL